MRFGRYGYAHILLRLGLGLTFVWIGIDMLRHPDIWIGFLPQTIPFDIGRDLALQGNAVFDIAIGALLITGNFPRLVSLLAVLHLAGILVVHKVDALLIRDVGLLGSALALFVWPYHRYKRHWWDRLFFWRRSGGGGED